jgi:hypothetical protein
LVWYVHRPIKVEDKDIGWNTMDGASGGGALGALANTERGDVTSNRRLAITPGAYLGGQETHAYIWMDICSSEKSMNMIRDEDGTNHLHVVGCRTDLRKPTNRAE